MIEVPKTNSTTHDFYGKSAVHFDTIFHDMKSNHEYCLLNMYSEFEVVTMHIIPTRENGSCPFQNDDQIAQQYLVPQYPPQLENAYTSGNSDLRKLFLDHCKIQMHKHEKAPQNTIIEYQSDI